MPPSTPARGREPRSACPSTSPARSRSRSATTASASTPGRRCRAAASRTCGIACRPAREPVSRVDRATGTRIRGHLGARPTRLAAAPSVRQAMISYPRPGSEGERPEERDARREEDEVNCDLLAVQDQEEHDPHCRDPGDEQRAAARGRDPGRLPFRTRLVWRTAHRAILTRAVGLGRRQDVQPEAMREESRHELALDAVAGRPRPGSARTCPILPCPATPRRCRHRSLLRADPPCRASSPDVVQAAVVMTASVCLQVEGAITRSPVTGFTPPSASVAPMTAIWHSR